MRYFKTGDLVEALRPEFPPMNRDHIRNAVEAGVIEAYRNPFFPDSGDYYFSPTAVRAWLTQAKMSKDQKLRVYERLGLHTQQLMILNSA